VFVVQGFIGQESNFEGNTLADGKPVKRAQGWGNMVVEVHGGYNTPR
jgi:hypothetical protein